MNPLRLLKSIARTAILLLALSSAGVSSAADLTAANRLFAAGDFAAATSAYQELIRTQGPTAARLYNLGNSQFRAGDLGAAILSYERARLLAPRDPDLLANLTLARKNATVYEQSPLPPWLESSIHWISRNEWAGLTAAATLVIGGACLFAGLRGLPSRTTRRSFVATCAASLLIAAIGTAALILRREDDHRAIVLTKDAPIRLSPFEKADAIGTPGAGRTVLVGVSNGGYLHVRVLGTDLTGWMFEGDVTPVIPRS